MKNILPRWFRVVVAALLLSLPVSAQAGVRVVTLAPHLAELVCAVDGCQSLVGVGRYSDYPEAVRALPQVGDAFAVHLETLLRLQPDVVLAWQDGMDASAVARAQQLGVNVVWIKTQTLDDIPRALMQIGELLGEGDAGARAAQAFGARLMALRARYQNRPPLRAFFQIDTAPAMSINRRSTIHEALTVCGADNVFADLPTVAAMVSLEAVIAAKPEVVISSQQDDARALNEYWQRLPMLAPSDARRRLTINGDWITRPTPRLLDGIAELCEKLEAVRALMLPQAGRI
ncbi:helical backbone metal receptor [Sinimarinibacterium sp. NLF-5-8]|uniref:helical backbone metal receptor n=1 Tax=Sinimarinibacterium sp. NLF-5-8 TaxID=2698684 RepID=UPI00137B9AA9|nr:helical backbone metal receptor [Sinimarinibacterium sp. NLF-5-8]QHS10477.1 ABC transporter substrate-binding protein [Sinimarinibacterium sp. NLF-5-8]